MCVDMLVFDNKLVISFTGVLPKNIWACEDVVSVRVVVVKATTNASVVSLVNIDIIRGHWVGIKPLVIWVRCRRWRWVVQWCWSW